MQSVQDGNILCASVSDFEEPEVGKKKHKHTILLNQVADVENLRIEPAVELHIVEALYAKFEV